ncbi:LysR family transcriptional regulator [Lactococcus garvieae]|uniref:LysR family transcriptional regulator n=1 Tax=Lactococcus garvieae TaxID=1363 RepID=UPI001F613C8B|nr:LysR family transcriptional regulator [Lactococcus garvieae]MCI3861390.1 LysR family transcriptional regulator [Lactococcus garvieae]
MQFNDLENFIIICESKTLYQAAQENFTSQPALTRSLHRLETRLDCTLVLRKRGQKKLILTQDGRWLYQQAKSIHAQIERVYRHMKIKTKNPAIFISTLCAAYTIQEELSQLVNYCNIQQQGGPHQNQWRVFQNSNCELGFIETSCKDWIATIDQEKYQVIAFRQDKIGVAINKQHPLTKKHKPITQNDLSPYSLLSLTPNYPTGCISLQFKNRTHSIPQNTQMISDLQTIKTLISHTDNFALITENKIGNRSDLSFLELDDYTEFIYTYIVVKRNKVDEQTLTQITNIFVNQNQYTSNINWQSGSLGT